MDKENWKFLAGGAAVLVGAVVFILGAVLLLSSWTTVPAGHVGILTLFGAVDDKSLPEGFNFKNPLKNTHKINIRTQEYKAEGDVPTRDGLGVHLEVSLLYSLKAVSAPTVYQKYSEKYTDVIVIPQFRSVVRNATAHYRAEDLYTANRQKIESDLFDEIKKVLDSEGVLAEGVLLREVKLPDVVRKAIEQKLAMDQAAQQMEFTIRKEKLEADRKRVEAQGIADAQKIIQETITDHYLKYLWIEALKECAKHGNTTIYIPTGGDGMPLFKDPSGEKKKP